MKLPFHLVINFAHTKQSVVQQAFAQFFLETGVPESGQEKDAFPLFDEWLIYDFKQPTGLSFLKEYILKNPDTLDEKTLSQLQDVVETQRYGGFEIVKVRRSEWIELKHLFLGEKFCVYDTASSSTIPEQGTLVARIGNVDNRWYFVGTNPLLLPLTYTSRMKWMMKGTSVYTSPKDTWQLLSIKQESPPTVTREEILKKRSELRKRYISLSEKYKISLAFDKLIKEIYQEDQKTPIDIFKKFTRQGFPEEVFIQNVDLFQDLWNYFPHKILKDKSPAEMFGELKKEQRQSETVSSSKHFGRNDPCWCGSGKKWKKCHYPALG